MYISWSHVVIWKLLDMPLLSKVSLPNLRARSKSDAAITDPIIQKKRSAFFRRGSGDDTTTPPPKLHKKTSFPSLRLKRQQDQEAMVTDVAPRSLVKMLSLPSFTRDPNKRGLRYRHEQPPPVPVIGQQYKETAPLITVQSSPSSLPLKSILIIKSDATTTPRKSIAGLSLFSRHQSDAFERPPPVIRHHREIEEQTSPRYTTKDNYDSDVSSISDYGDADVDTGESIRSLSASTRDESIFSRKSIETCREETRVSNDSYSSIDESANWKPPKMNRDKRLPLTISEAMQMRGRSSSFPVNGVQEYAPRKMSEPAVLSMHQETSAGADRAGLSKLQSSATTSSNASVGTSKGSTSSAPYRPTRPDRPSNLLLEQPSPIALIKTHLPERPNRLDRISNMVGKSFIKGLTSKRPTMPTESSVKALMDDPTMAIEYVPNHLPKPSCIREGPDEPSYLDQMMTDPTKTFSETVSWKNPQRNVPMQFSRYDYLFEDKKKIPEEMPRLPPLTRSRMPEPIPETVKVRSFRLGGASREEARPPAEPTIKTRSNVISGVVSDWTKLLLGEAFDRAGKWESEDGDESDYDCDTDNGAVLRVREHEKGIFEVIM